MLDSVVSPSVYRLIDATTKTITDLEQVVFSVLHPAVSKNPVHLHLVETNIRFRSWVRQAYLRKRFGNSAAIMLAENLFLTDMTKVPTISKLNSLFNTGDWDRNPTSAENSNQIELVRQYEAALATKDMSHLSKWTLEDLLECIGCCVKGMNEFNWYCEKHFIYEFFTRDYIEKLVDHIEKSADDICPHKSDTSTFRVLEVGAGNGQLSYLIEKLISSRRTMKSRSKPWKLEMIATDTGTWKAKAGTAASSVQKMDYRAAIDKYKPDIVLCSWMPLGEDWTQAMRQAESIQEYILIGEIDDGCCGDPWRTWGRHVDIANDPMFSKNKGNENILEEGPIDVFHWLGKSSSAIADSAEECDKTVPPFEVDQFSRLDLDFRDLQISRYDRAQYANNSHTVSFKRVGSK